MQAKPNKSPLREGVKRLSPLRDWSDFLPKQITSWQNYSQLQWPGGALQVEPHPPPPAPDYYINDVIILI